MSVYQKNRVRKPHSEETKQKISNTFKKKGMMVKELGLDTKELDEHFKDVMGWSNAG